MSASLLALLAAAGPAGCRDPAAGPGKLSGARQLPVYRILRADGPIAVDGRLEDPPWRRAFELPLVNSVDGSPPRRPTVARLLWDDEYLYVSFEAWDGALPGPREGDLRDDVALIVDPEGAGRGYLEIEVSAANGRFAARLQGPKGDLAAARAWPKVVSVARPLKGTDGGRGFAVEIAISLDSLRGEATPPRAGARWRANLYRFGGGRRAGAIGGQAFSPQASGESDALGNSLGYLVFDGGAPVSGARQAP